MLPVSYGYCCEEGSEVLAKLQGLMAGGDKHQNDDAQRRNQTEDEDVFGNGVSARPPGRAEFLDWHREIKC